MVLVFHVLFRASVAQQPIRYNDTRDNSQDGPTRFLQKCNAGLPKRAQKFRSTFPLECERRNRRNSWSLPRAAPPCCFLRSIPFFSQLKLLEFGLSWALDISSDATPDTRLVRVVERKARLHPIQFSPSKVQVHFSVNRTSHSIYTEDVSNFGGQVTVAVTLSPYGEKIIFTSQDKSSKSYEFPKKRMETMSYYAVVVRMNDCHSLRA